MEGDLILSDEEAVKNYQMLNKYLSTRMEIADSGNLVEIKVNNTYPDSPNYPKVVFFGVGISIADYSKIRVRDWRVIRKEGEIEKFGNSPWDNDDEYKTLKEIQYNRLNQQPFFTDFTSDERASGEVLFPGQSVTFQINILAKELPFIQFRIEGTISRRHLFHLQKPIELPNDLAKQAALKAFTAYNAINIHEPLINVINSIAKIDSNNRLSELQSFITVLRQSQERIPVILQELDKVVREFPLMEIRLLNRASFVYLWLNVRPGLENVIGSLASNDQNKITANTDALHRLKGMASMLNQVTKELMRKYSISEEETGYKYQDW